MGILPSPLKVGGPVGPSVLGLVRSSSNLDSLSSSLKSQPDFPNSHGCLLPTLPVGLCNTCLWLSGDLSVPFSLKVQDLIQDSNILSSTEISSQVLFPWSSLE